MAGSVGSGTRALAHNERTLPGVSAPSKVVRSIIEIAVSIAHAFDVVLIDRVPRPATRASAPTWSTPGRPCSQRRRTASVSRDTPSRSRAVVDADAAAIANNVKAVLIAALVAEIVRWVVIGRGRNAAYRHPVVVGIAVVGYAIVARIVWQFFADEVWFVKNAHNWAAVTMFVGIILVILTNAIGAYLSRERGWAAGYITTAVLMAVLLVWAIIATAQSENADRVFWIEVVLIASFGLFWGLQTTELWNFSDRSEKTEVRSEKTGTPVPDKGVLNEISGV